MSTMGDSQTFASELGDVRFTPKADMLTGGIDVRLVPKANSVITRHYVVIRLNG